MKSIWTLLSLAGSMSSTWGMKGFSFVMMTRNPLWQSLRLGLIKQRIRAIWWSLAAYFSHLLYVLTRMKQTEDRRHLRGDLRETWLKSSEEWAWMFTSVFLFFSFSFFFVACPLRRNIHNRIQWRRLGTCCNKNSPFVCEKEIHIRRRPYLAYQTGILEERIPIMAPLTHPDR